MIPAWLSYGLSDLLMFSPRTFYRLIEGYNAEWWPLHLAGLAIGLLLLVSAVRQQAAMARIGVGLLALWWAWLAWAFFHQRYATINWAADYVALAFAAQALVLAAFSAWPGSNRGWSGGTARHIGVGLLGFGVLVQPVLHTHSADSLHRAEVFGIMPDPTVVATLGMLLLAQGRTGWSMIIPVAWCLASGATAWTLGQPGFWLMPTAAAVACAGRVLQRGNAR